MLALIKKIYKFLTKKQKRQFFLLQFLIVGSNLLEIVGFVSIVPFLSLVNDPKLLERSKYLAYLYEVTDFSSQDEFVIFFGVTSFLMMVTSLGASVLKQWLVTMFANQIGFGIGNQLYEYYLNQNYLFHTLVNSSRLISNISVEAIRVKNIIKSLMHINGQIFLSIFILSGLMVARPLVTSVGAAIFLSSYFLIYKLVKSFLQSNGEVLTSRVEERYRLLGEGLGAIRDIHLLMRHDVFIERFNKTGNTIAESTTKNQVIAAVPMQFMQLVFFGSIVSFILILFTAGPEHIDSIVPTVILFTVAGLKMLPSFQQIYSNLAQIKGNISAFYSIERDLDSIIKERKTEDASPGSSFLTGDIEFREVGFTYPDRASKALDEVNLTIKEGQVVGIVGESGAGKSTLVDVLASLIEPDYGEIRVAGIPVSLNNRRSWQGRVGYISQNISLLDGDFIYNITFAEDEEAIELEKVREAVEFAHLNNVIESQPQGLLTEIGEKGVQLSGGQKQRVGIARAFYNNPDVLILDEVTSALDGETEEKVLKSLFAKFRGKTIIMIAHRLNTLSRCDVIFSMDSGRITKKGCYADYLKENEKGI